MAGLTDDDHFVAIEQVVERLAARFRRHEEADSVDRESIAKEKLRDIKESLKMAEVLAKERIVDIKEWRADVQDFVRDLASVKADVSNIRVNADNAALEVKDEIKWVRRLLLSVLVTAVLSGALSSLLVAFGSQT